MVIVDNLTIAITVWALVILVSVCRLEGWCGGDDE